MWLCGQVWDYWFEVLSLIKDNLNCSEPLDPPIWDLGDTTGFDYIKFVEILLFFGQTYFQEMGFSQNVFRTV